jgi:hypothetical protein
MILEISPEMYAYVLVFGKLGIYKISLSCQFVKSKALFNFMHWSNCYSIYK